MAMFNTDYDYEVYEVWVRFGYNESMKCKEEDICFYWVTSIESNTIDFAIACRNELMEELKGIKLDAMEKIEVYKRCNGKEVKLFWMTDSAVIWEI